MSYAKDFVTVCNRHLGRVLAEELPQFSLDLIGLTAQYLTFAAPSKTVKPQEFFTYRYPGDKYRWQLVGCDANGEELKLMIYDATRANTTIGTMWCGCAIEETISIKQQKVVDYCRRKDGWQLILLNKGLELYDAQKTLFNNTGLKNHAWRPFQSIAVDAAGRVYLGTRNERSILVLNQDFRRPVRLWGAIRVFTSPERVAVVTNPATETEEVWVNDHDEHKWTIYRFEIDGKFIGQRVLSYVDSENYHRFLYHFNHIDFDGQVYADHEKGIKIFDFEGKHLTTLELPEGMVFQRVCVGPDRVIYVVDKHNNIHAFGYPF